MKWIEINGASLRYELAGQGNETVVLLHEMGGTIDSWNETLPSFLQHFQTLRYDQRGCGYSEKVRGKISLEDMVGDMVALLDSLGIRTPCHVIGYAFSSLFAMGFAARHPARIARLVISSPVTGPAGVPRPGQAQRADIVEREGMRSYVGNSLDTSYPEALRGNKVRWEAFRGRWLANDPYCYAAINRLIHHADLIKELRNITCPTLVIGNTHDTQRPPAVAKAVAAQIRGARYAELASGHFAPVQTPELFVQQVVPFLRGQAPRA